MTRRRLEKFVYVWSMAEPENNPAERCHIVRTSERRPGTFRQVPVTYCSKRLPLNETSPYPHPNLPICPRCKERAHA